MLAQKVGRGANSEPSMNVVSVNQFASIRTSAVFVLCGFVLLGCSKKIEEKTEAPKSQVVARIGDGVVTTQELDNEFRLANVPVEKRKDPAAIKQVLGNIVTRKYLVRQALVKKLDREPTVLLDILRARELVLANAVASRELSEKSAAIARADIDKYVANNPLKFADRQIMTTEQIVVPASSISQTLMDETKDANSLDQVDQKLTAMGIAHSRASGALSSGDVSPDFLKMILAKQADNVFFIHVDQNGIFFKVKDIESRPLEGEGAANVARQLMRIDLLRSEASMAAVAANLEAKYEGDYANIMGAQNSDQPSMPK
jgi:EpsD family peptidyl-prolyl cis-trans isomerase